MIAPSAQAQGSCAAELTDIDHFIVLTKKNRSFDHYFVTLSGVRGFDDQAGRGADGSSI